MVPYGSACSWATAPRVHQRGVSTHGRQRAPALVRRTLSAPSALPSRVSPPPSARAVAACPTAAVAWRCSLGTSCVQCQQCIVDFIDTIQQQYQHQRSTMPACCDQSPARGATQYQAKGPGIHIQISRCVQHPRHELEPQVAVDQPSQYAALPAAIIKRQSGTCSNGNLNAANPKIMINSSPGRHAASWPLGRESAAYQTKIKIGTSINPAPCAIAATANDHFPQLRPVSNPRQPRGLA